MNKSSGFDTEYTGNEIAIIGLQGRFPGARDVKEFWENIRDGVESISFFSDEELIAQGVEPSLLKNPNYVKARGVLDDIEYFDAQFFDYSPRDAEIIDPQQRLFLETAWQALEGAGYDATSYEGRIGVYAGLSTSTYFLFHLFGNHTLFNTVGLLPITIGNTSDYLATRVSYKLNLRGPGISVQTACSTSLVAVHLACQSLLSGECEMALAGGVAISTPHKVGYVYQEGGIVSPDGHSRAFDAQASGTVFSSGLGVVVLKRLEDALQDGDSIHAIIKGSAMNNDGAVKIGYTAPGVQSQSEVIAEALALADVDPETISYVETHGTGTPLGDPIEVTALSRAFSVRTSRKGFCALGSVKTNIGHLDAAAGIAGLIKAVMALKHGYIPASLHYYEPNPQINFVDSPFYVNTTLKPFPIDGGPRRASVSSFGIGGTNVHAILEEAPTIPSSSPARPWQIIPLSARTPTALVHTATQLLEHIEHQPSLSLPDMAYTLQIGRKAFEHRQMIVCQDIPGFVQALEKIASGEVSPVEQASTGHSAIFLFPGQGTQYVNMGRELYQHEPVFRQEIDRCSTLLIPTLGVDLRTLLYPDDVSSADADTQLAQTWLTQPVLFAIEYACARLWMSWGIVPHAMIGHSIGEYLAACLAGVFSLEDALALVATRGRLMQTLPAGAMLAVALPEDEIYPLLEEQLSLAAVNAPNSCVLSGPPAAIEAVIQKLEARHISYQRLRTSHAFHSSMMEPILEKFFDEAAKIKFHVPEIPYISNVTGTWITQTEAIDPNYWTNHLRQTVRFAQGIQELTKAPDTIIVEVGTGLSTLVKNSVPRTLTHVVLSSLPSRHERTSEYRSLLTALGHVWLKGREVNWAALHIGERRLRLPLPTYPFERQRYWIERLKRSTQNPAPEQLEKRPDIAEWFYIPTWKQAPLLPSERSSEQRQWLLFSDKTGLSDSIAAHLHSNNQKVITVIEGEQWNRDSDTTYTINWRNKADYEALIDDLERRARSPQEIIHCGLVTSAMDDRSLSEHERVRGALEHGFYSLLFLAQVLSKQYHSQPIHIRIISTNMQGVLNEDVISPEKATVLGLTKVISQEYSRLSCSTIDLSYNGNTQQKKQFAQLLQELTLQPSEWAVAYTGQQRWVQVFEALHLKKSAERPALLRKDGVYLITGGLGNIGLAIADYLAAQGGTKLILTGRTALPNRNEWSQWLQSHEQRDTTSKKIRSIMKLEQQGAEVLIYSADIGDEQQMRNVISLIDKRFGTLSGVIHAAGLMGQEAFGPIEKLDVAECEKLFYPKIHGLLVLEKVLQGRTLDFYFLLSSLSTILGGLGLAAYSSANAFMDAFAQKQTCRDATPWISVNWDSWQGEINEGVGEQRQLLGSKLSEFALTHQEGQEAFARIVAVDSLPQIIVSTADLRTRFAQWIAREKPVKSQEAPLNEVATRHARPQLQTVHVLPRNALEQTIADIWQELLGLEQIGVFDDFLDLGGHSLLAMQVISRLREAFQIHIPLRTLFDAQTIAQLAEVIEEMFIAKLEELPEEVSEEHLVRSLLPGYQVSSDEDRSEG